MPGASWPWGRTCMKKLRWSNNLRLSGWRRTRVECVALNANTSAQSEPTENNANAATHNARKQQRPNAAGAIADQNRNAPNADRKRTERATHTHTHTLRLALHATLACRPGLHQQMFQCFAERLCDAREPMLS
eukprot:11031991-Lingulodinium_polyedra.AAC.1